MSNLELQSNVCPICSNIDNYNPRYENYICRTCVQKASDFDGELLEFFNTDISGGFKALYKNSKQQYKSHFCYINGVKCYANEARFGGIVVTVCDEIKK